MGLPGLSQKGKQLFKLHMFALGMMLVCKSIINRLWLEMRRWFLTTGD